MDYEFPKITIVDQIRDVIKDREEIVEIERDGYVLFDYLVVLIDTFPPVETEADAIRRECRGIAFDSETGNIIRRPFHKFFNLNEREETQAHHVELGREHTIFHKYDGSMIAPLRVNDEIIWGTRKTASEFHTAVSYFVEHNSEMDYKGFTTWCLDNGATPMFEYMSPDNTIVIKYEQTEMPLLAIRSMTTGKYFPDNIVNNLCKKHNIPAAGIAFDSIDNIDDFATFFRGFKDNREGVVIRMNDGHHIKLKTDQYVLAHRAKALLKDKDVIKMIVQDTLDDILPYLSEEDQKDVLEFRDKVYHGIRETAKRIQSLAQEFIDDKTPFADIAKSEKIKDIWPMQSILFQAVRGANEDETFKKVLTVLSRHVSSGPRIDAVRSHLGGFVFSSRSLPFGSVQSSND